MHIADELESRNELPPNGAALLYLQRTLIHRYYNTVEDMPTQTNCIEITK